MLVLIKVRTKDNVGECKRLGVQGEKGISESEVDGSQDKMEQLTDTNSCKDITKQLLELMMLRF